MWAKFVKSNRIVDRLFYGIISLLVVTLGGLGSLIIGRHLANEKAHLEEKVETTGVLLEKLLPSAVADLSVKKIREFLESPSADLLQVLEIFDAAGERVYVYERRENKETTYDRTNVFPLFEGGETIGSVKVYYAVGPSMERLRIQEFLQLIILISGAGLILGIALLLLVRRVILRPIYNTLNFSRALAAGNYDQRIAVNNETEMGLLQRSLNQMADAHKRLVNTLKSTVHEAELARSEAQEASRLKGEFLANMSHEIRTPMNAILGFTELLLEEENDPEKRHTIETIRKSAHILLDGLNDILDFSKLEPGKLKLEKNDFLLGDLLDEVTQVIRLKLQNKKVSLNTEVPQKFRGTIHSDRHRLRQILLNLLTNAVKFTHEGNITLKVTQPEKSQYLQFEVADTGIGIPKEDHTIIFEPFIQVDSSHTRQYGGTGLGLAIVKKLVEMLGGRIWVESRPGDTRFYFLLPKETA